MNPKEKSPFTPGSPVPVELFVGRMSQLEEIIRFARQSTHNKPENIFLVGDRGIGKSSLASFLNHYANTQLNLLGVHVFLGRSNSEIDQAVRQVLDQLLKVSQGQSWWEKLKQLFGNRITELGLFNITISFTASKSDLAELVRNFPEVIEEIVNKIKDTRDGLVIILDDINGLVERQEFARWYKSVVDTVAIKKLPILVMLIGTPEKWDQLARMEQSLMRIFRIIKIERLNDEEVKTFFEKSFSSVGIKVNKDALTEMTKFSSGLPILMHEIGDAVFWLDQDDNISLRDAKDGILRAAINIGSKYLDPRVYRAIRSEAYKSILRKLGEELNKIEFSRSQLSDKLNQQEKRVFDNFLRKMKQLGVIESDPDKQRGCYKFTNYIYPVYISLESAQSRA